jgi:hypothetical protein
VKLPRLGTPVFYFSLDGGPWNPPTWLAALIVAENHAKPMMPVMHVYFPTAEVPLVVIRTALYYDSDPPEPGTWRYQPPPEKTSEEVKT